MAALHLEAGKRYVARNGMITTPVEIEKDDEFVCCVAAEIGDRFEIWTGDGYVFGPWQPHPFDLVAVAA